ncbi:hypothetical protein [Sporichthya sp.]|uniref:hypothetical protein n=1 Tax=Sporichthya sp. TaxID=65475 RepID=UPI00180F5D92|nr:hypothetical protein [Sporichthya sp.]MBA3742449.1 hypothetical protein [Sporichthya sp.]
MPETEIPDSTLADVRPGGPRRAARVSRRVGLALLALVVLLGATTLLGVHTSSATARAEGYEVRVDYPRIARAGLDIKWRVTVRHAGGFGSEPITLAVSARYFDIFEHQAFYPDPSKSTGDGEMLELEFDPPDGDVFSVDLDAYVQPASQLGRRGSVVLMDGDRERVRVEYRTWLIP